MERGGGKGSDVDGDVSVCIVHRGDLQMKRAAGSRGVRVCLGKLLNVMFNQSD